MIIIFQEKNLNNIFWRVLNMNEVQDQANWMSAAREKPKKSPTGQVIKFEGVTHAGEKLVGYKDVAEYMGVSYGYLRQLVSNDYIPYYKLGRSVRFRLSEIDKWLSNRKSRYRSKK
jgi:excisionase family DNA binding protein